jgi:hypothetical protein
MTDDPWCDPVDRLDQVMHTGLTRLPWIWRLGVAWLTGLIALWQEGLEFLYNRLEEEGRYRLTHGQDLDDKRSVELEPSSTRRGEYRDFLKYSETEDTPC